MKEKLKSLRVWFFRFCSFLGLLLLSLQIYRTYYEFRTQSISIRNYWPLLAAIIVFAFSIIIQIRAWRVLMACTKIKLAPLEACYGYSISFLARYIPGAVWGYLSRSEWLFQNFGLNYFLSNYFSVLEILLTILAGVSAIGLSLLVDSGSPASLGAGVLLVSLPFLIWHPLLSDSYLSAKNWLAGLWKKDEIRLSPTFKAWGTILLLCMINWFLYSLSLFLIGVSLGAWSYPQLFSTWASLTTIYCIAWFIGFIVVFIPSGLGIRELALSALLIGQLHLAPGIAQGMSIFMRFEMTVAELLSIVIFTMLRRYLPKSN